MPDEVLGEKTCAYLVLPDGEAFDIATMREFLAARGVAQFKWPERIELVRELPLTNVGKIRKTELRADIARKIADERTAAAHR
jgi:2,3-dihydroxybenzoate-AMP ligase